jgi:hypothetical protein
MPRINKPSGYGVTAFDYLDAVQLLRERVFSGKDLPAIGSVIEDVDISTLDDRHVRPNMGVPVWRGVWYPNLGDWQRTTED